MKNLLLGLFLFTPIYLGGQTVRLVENKIKDAQDYLHRDAKMGLKASMDRFARLKEMERQVKDGKMEQSRLLNEVAEWKKRAGVAESEQKRISGDLANIKKDLDKLKKDLKDKEETYNALKQSYDSLLQEKDFIKQQYDDLLVRFDAMAKENAALKMDIGVLKKELSSAAKKSFKDGIYIAFKKDAKDNSGWDGSYEVIPRKKYDKIQIRVKFSLSPNANIQLNAPKVNVVLHYLDRKTLSKQIDLSVKKMDGFWEYSGMKEISAKTDIKSLSGLMDFNIISWEKDFSAQRKVKFID